MRALAPGISTIALAQGYVDDDFLNDTHVQMKENLLEDAFITS